MGIWFVLEILELTQFSMKYLMKVYVVLCSLTLRFIKVAHYPLAKKLFQQRSAHSTFFLFFSVRYSS